MNRVIVFSIQLIATSLVTVSLSYAVESESYLNVESPFIKIDDVNRESEAWAACAATYNILSAAIERSKPEMAKHLKDMGKGAEMAITMSIFSNSILSNVKEESYGYVFENSKIVSKEIYAAERNKISADIERLGKPGFKTALQKLSKTQEICASNIEAQQAYVDIWRDMAKQGIIRLK